MNLSKKGKDRLKDEGAVKRTFSIDYLRRYHGSRRAHRGAVYMHACSIRGDLVYVIIRVDDIISISTPQITLSKPTF